MAITAQLPRSVDLYAALPQTDYTEGRDLAAGVAERIVIPLDANGVKARYVLFSGNADFNALMGNGSVTATATADTTDGSASPLNPTFRKIADAHTHISLISAGGAKVTMEFFLGI